MTGYRGRGGEGEVGKGVVEGERDGGVGSGEGEGRGGGVPSVLHPSLPLAATSGLQGICFRLGPDVIDGSACLNRV